MIAFAITDFFEALFNVAILCAGSVFFIFAARGFVDFFRD
jgi:hypothetical protein